MTPTHELPEDDDAAAELLADTWVDQAATDPRLRRLALRAAGLAKEPAEMSVEELSRHLGTDRHAVGRIALKALSKLRYTPEIQSLNPNR